MYDLRGGVGDRRESFGFLCRDFRERIDPAQDFTFLFLLGFLDIEERLELVRRTSIDSIGTSGEVNSGEDGAVSAFLDSFADDAALVGRDLGDDSPEALSWPKNDHFFADLGVEGADSAARSLTSEREPRLCDAVFGQSSWSLSRIGSAVRGLTSITLVVDGM